MSFTVTNALRWWAREAPDRVALSVEDEPLTYRELLDWASHVAVRLLDAGLEKGDRVAIAAFNSMEYAVLEVAIVLAGGIIAPISFRSSGRELQKSFAGLAPRLFFGDAGREAVMREAMAPEQNGRFYLLNIIREWRTEGTINKAICKADPDDPIFIIGTSGSTGTPKGVVETHFCVVSYSAEFVLMEPKCGAGASILVVGPFSSSSATLVMMQFLVSGATIYIQKQFKPARALQLLVEKKITIFLAATIFFERIAALEEFKTANLSSLYFSQAGGARVSTSMLAAWREKGAILRQAYGCTEAGGAWAARDDVALTSLEKAGRGGMFTHYAIADDQGNFVAPGEQGEILVCGTSVTPGYWDNDEATASVIKDGWLRTGDIGIMDETDNITFIDRKKDIIISGGLNVSAKEIEDVVARIDSVEEVAVIAAADTEFGETPLVIVYGQTEKLSTSVIIDQCYRELARYKVPKYVVIENEHLPRTTSGKISKPDLRVRYKNAAAELAPAR